jgi:hypothetical protein
MKQTPADDSEDSEMDRFYLPAVAARPDFGRVEAVLTDLFEGHGLVRIPDTYNR